MSIGDELEKLSALKAKGDLSPEEFEKAKALLLDKQQVPVLVDAMSPRKPTGKEVRMRLLSAVLMTLAAVMSGVSLGLGPNPLKIVAFLCFVVAAIFSWLSYAKGMAETDS